MTSLYRSTLDVARADLRVAREREADVLFRSRALVPIAAARLGRVVFGATLLAALLGIFLSALLGTSSQGAAPVVILAVAFPAACAFARLAERAARAVLRGRLDEAARRCARHLEADEEGDPFAELASLEDRPALTAKLFALLAAAEGPALVLPLLGMCLLAPLTIHFVVFAVVTTAQWLAGSSPEALGAYGSWMALSVIFAGAPHLALVVYCAWFVQRLRHRPLEPLPSPMRPVWIATFSSAIPGGVFVIIGGLGLLPMAITFVTGRLFLPATFSRAIKVFRAERDREAELRGSLPRAVASRFDRAPGYAGS